MRVSFLHRDGSSDLDISGLPSDATVGDLITVAWPTADHVLVDGRSIDFDSKLFDHVRDGSEIAVDAQPLPESDRIVASLHVLTGPAAGHVWQLEPGCYRVGANSTIPLDGVDATLTIDSNGRGLWDSEPVPDGALQVGTHRVRLARRFDDGTPHPTGTRSFFNRPPRHVHTTTERLIPVPVKETVNGKPRRFSMIMLILPMVTGVAMALILGRLLFLAFALLGPITMIGTTIDDRRRRKRDTRENAEKYEHDLEQFEQMLFERASTTAVAAFDENPSTSELLLRATTRSQRTWERRSDHDDFLRAVVGYGAATWKPTLAGTSTDERVDGIVARGSALPDGPVTMTFAATRILGVAGDRERAQQLAADVVAQLAATHGPVDLRVAVLTDQPTAWDWLKWLPHTASNQLSDLRLLASSEAEIAALLATLRSPGDGAGPTILLVVDHHDLDDDEQRIVRECLSGVGKPVAGLVLVDRVESLPAASTEVVELGGRPRFRRPYAGLIIDEFDPAGVRPTVSRKLSMAIASLDDPESNVAGAGLPDLVRLLDLLDLAEPDASLVEARWSSGGRAPRIVAPVGSGETGPYSIDLVRDGPHGLMAGTTGSGKSEFLRTYVAGLAANVSPEYLTFVLVDYKGGAAFDVCADLPHVVGLVTDLDEHLGERALQSLEAELHHREERLREAGATDIDDFWSMRHADPLPRLAVVVDEFATLAKELPDFMDALVDIAQRGRSLGVHMILATQRPSGVIKDSIRANTNLRISLRVQTPADSKDVLNSADAAALPRSKPGRGYARLGPGELVPFQTALSTMACSNQGPATRVTPFVFGMSQPQPPAMHAGSTGPTDLERLVNAIRDAWRQRSRAAPRRPWTEPLPLDLAWSDLPAPAETTGAVIGLADQPKRQRRSSWCWNPHDDGNLLLIGSAGWGPTDGLLGAVAGLAAGHDPDQVSIYGIDHGGGRLAGAECLPHVGSIVPGSDIERQKRLLRHLRDEIDRREGHDSGLTVVLVLDGIAGFKSTFDNAETVPYRDMLQEIAVNGPRHGVFMAASADQNRSVPSALAGALRKRLVFTLSDRLEYGMLGIKGSTDLPRRRAIDPLTQEHVQVGSVDVSDLERISAEASMTTRTPEPIRALPRLVSVADVVDAGEISEEAWTLPLGLDDDTLRAATLKLFDGDHIMVAGPARSGRTTTLETIASIVSKLDPGIAIHTVCPRPSSLRLNPTLASVTKATTELDLAEDVRALVLVDDCEESDDGGVLTEIIESRRPGVTIVAAGRIDALRGAHRHWTKSVRATRRGIILKPFDSSDGDILSIRLPRSARPIDLPGRGYLVDAGIPSLIQIAKT